MKKVVWIKEIAAAAFGMVLLAAMPPMKQELARTITTYLTFCRNYGVNIVTGRRRTALCWRRET